MSRAPMTGHAYTMSVMKHPCGDRSWTHEVWEVLESNGTHAVIRVGAPEYSHSFGAQPMVVSVHEFDWTPADELLEALKANRTPLDPTKSITPMGESR